MYVFHHPWSVRFSYHASYLNFGVLLYGKTQFWKYWRDMVQIIGSKDNEKATYLHSNSTALSALLVPSHELQLRLIFERVQFGSSAVDLIFSAVLHAACVYYSYRNDPSTCGFDGLLRSTGVKLQRSANRHRNWAG